MQKSFANKVIVVTGGTAGIGRSIAYHFAKQGAKVYIFGSNQERGETAEKELRELAGIDTIYFRRVDVAKTSEVETAIEAIIATEGSIDILVNNAGVTRDNLILRMSEDDWDSVINTNLKSVYNTCRAVTRPMMKSRKGKIINISSVIGLTGNAGQVNYAASKSGIIGVTKSLAKELASRNICVNCIAPGFVETRMTEGLTDKLKDTILGTIPLKRMGLPDEIAYAVLFLASDNADYITGQVITVDGGMTI